MRQTIADNEFYNLVVDLQKQRLFVELKGAWSAQETAEKYLEDLRKSTSFFEGNFTCLADFSALQPFSYPSRNNVHIKAVHLLRKAGVSRSAEVMPNDSKAHAQLLKVAEYSGVRLSLFGEPEIAELFLDAPAAAFLP